MADYNTKKYYNTPIYNSWYNMKTRCYNKNYSLYHRYGGRGIKVCDEWKSFSGFLEAMENGYKKGLSLDRINNDKGYSKENCRWATAKEQANNTKNVKNAKRYKHKNNLYTIKELSKMFDIKRSTLWMRLEKYNWSLNKSLNII